jgi:hypothetical protein
VAASKATWKGSEAKTFLERSYQDPSSNIHSMTRKEIYESNSLFQEFQYSNFQRNAKYLRNKLAPSPQFQAIYAGTAVSTAAPTAMAKKPHAWKSSIAKEMLRQEFIKPSSNIHRYTAEEIYMPNLSVFGVYPLANFKKNFESLKRSIQLMVHLPKRRMRLYRTKYVPFVQQHPNPTLLWHCHDAKALLKRDAQEGLLNQYTPKQLWCTRAEYQAFTLPVFHSHSYQQKYKLLADTYWVVKRNKKAQKQREMEAERLNNEWDL